MVFYPKKNLFLHIGFPKTGSSAIQSLLACNGEHLKSRGYSYSDDSEAAKSFKISSGNGKALIQYLNDFINDEAVYSYYFQHDLPNIVISSEALGLNKTKLSKIVKLCKKYNIHLEMIAYIRDIAPFAISSYHQSIKRHNNTKTFSEFIKTPWYIRHINLAFLLGDPSLQAIKDDVDWELKLLHYDSDKEQIFISFCNAIGADINKLEIPNKRVNRSLIPTEIEALRILNVCAKKANLTLDGFISDNLVNKLPDANYRFAIKPQDLNTIKEVSNIALEKFNQTFSERYGFILSLGDVDILKKNENNNAEILHLPTVRKCAEIFYKKHINDNTSKFSKERVKKFAKEISRIDYKAGKIALYGQSKNKFFIKIKQIFPWALARLGFSEA